ncbi:MAG: hypothetical protein KAK04_07395, partial [Cyclobacteriaceae bacterium]|nr:hypothetical protein [Cyclobacteriaceae bacterium]
MLFLSIDDSKDRKESCIQGKISKGLMENSTFNIIKMKHSTTIYIFLSILFSQAFLFSCINIEDKKQAIANLPNVILIMTD